VAGAGVQPGGLPMWGRVFFFFFFFNIVKKQSSLYF